MTVAHLPTALWLALAISLSAIAADAHPPVFEAVQIGLADTYKLGQWTPVTVRWRVSNSFVGRSIIRLPDPNGDVAEFARQASGGLSEGSYQWTSYVKFAGVAGDLRVALKSMQGQQYEHRIAAAQVPRALSSSQQFVLVLGDDIGAFQAVDARPGRRSERTVARRLSQPSELPQHWLGYSSVDVVVLAGNRNGWRAGVSDTQWAALRRWTELGGTVIAGGAAGADELFGADGPLAWMVPGKLSGVVQLRETSGLEQFVGAKRPLESNAAEPLVSMSVVREVTGRVEATEGFGAQQSPAIIRGTAGLGRVVFVPFDLDQPPFANWPDRPRLLGKLLDMTLDVTSVDEDSQAERETARRSSYDLVGQLRHALDQFPGVRLIPFSWIAGLAAIYIALVGPLDYWLLRRLRRPHWTWLTFTAGVLAFAGLSVMLARFWKGDEYRANLVTLVDADLASGTVRGTTWAHLFSPQTRRATLLARPVLALDWQSVPLQQATSWQGLPGDSFAGLDRESRNPSSGQAYRVALNLSPPNGADIRLEEFPLTIWSSQSVLSQWWGNANWLSTGTQLVVGANATLSGTIVNPWPGELRDAYLVFDRSAVRLGNLKQDDHVTLKDAAGIDLQTLLTQRKVLDGRSVVTPWDPHRSSLERVLQLLMFYQAAKGRAYTRSLHRYHRWIDWSDQVQLQQAVLWGRGSFPTAELLVDDQVIKNADGAAWLRVLIPVRRSEEDKSGD